MDLSNMKVRILVGAQAYACITVSGVSMDVALSPGMGPSKSLRISAKELREKARKDIERADRMEFAAGVLEEGAQNA